MWIGYDDEREYICDSAWALFSRVSNHVMAKQANHAAPLAAFTAAAAAIAACLLTLISSHLRSWELWMHNTHTYTHHSQILKQSYWVAQVCARSRLSSYIVIATSFVPHHHHRIIVKKSNYWLHLMHHSVAIFQNVYTAYVRLISSTYCRFKPNLTIWASNSLV